jgi:oxygen-independent coproporphyrinogen III oxidase
MDPMLARHLYVHVPFCRRRCSYCDFSIAVRRTTPVDEFVRGISSELRIRRLNEDRLQLNTLYLGGGTPSQLGGDGVDRLMSTIRDQVELDASAEVTLEANPEDVTPASARTWLASGITRVSLGSQSFDDTVLTWMHRVHSGDAIGRAFHTLREAGFRNLSLDLIFALPPEIPRDWERDLEAATQLGPEHVSLYGLTVEPHTPLARWRDRGAVADCVEDRYEEEFLVAHRSLAAAGFEHYEVSNFGKPDFRSRHNSSYWSQAPYVGLGPSAHGFDGNERRWNEPVYNRWLESVDASRDPVAGLESLTPANRLAESVYLGLRTDRGLELEEAEFESIDRWVDAGWANRRQNHVTLTALGWLRLDALAISLTDLRSR